MFTKLVDNSFQDPEVGGFWRVDRVARASGYFLGCPKPTRIPELPAVAKNFAGRPLRFDKPCARVRVVSRGGGRGRKCRPDQAHPTTPIWSNIMAKVLKHWDWRAPVGRGSGVTYDWDTWLDGKLRMLEEGEGKDFQCKVATFSTLARNAGKARGLVVRINKTEGGLVLQASPASKEQLKAWRDAEEAAAKAAAAREANGEATK
jgi:hypothetical protein